MSYHQCQQKLLALMVLEIGGSTMNYVAPDYELIAINAADNFAAYGCPPDEDYYWSHTVPCEGTANWGPISETFIDNGITYTCYTTLKP